LKNNKCFKFIDTKNEILVSNKLRIRSSKNHQNNEFKKIVYFWLRFVEIDVQFSLLNFIKYLFKDFTKNFVFFERSTNKNIEMRLEFW